MQRSVLDVKPHDLYEALEALHSAFVPSLPNVLAHCLKIQSPGQPTWVRGDITGNFELLKGNLGPVRKEEQIPIHVPHGCDNPIIASEVAVQAEAGSLEALN